MIAADLSEELLIDVLTTETSWDVEADSIVIAEGLLMYLKPSDVIELFKQTAATTGSNSGFAFSHFFAKRNGSTDLGLFGDFAIAGLRMLGEPVRWSIRKEDVADFVTGTGWRKVPADKHPMPDGAGIEGYVLLQRA